MAHELRRALYDELVHAEFPSPGSVNHLCPTGTARRTCRPTAPRRGRRRTIALVSSVAWPGLCRRRCLPRGARRPVRRDAGVGPGQPHERTAEHSLAGQVTPVTALPRATPAHLPADPAPRVPAASAPAANTAVAGAPGHPVTPAAPRSPGRPAVAPPAAAPPAAATRLPAGPPAGVGPRAAAGRPRPRPPIR